MRVIPVDTVEDVVNDMRCRGETDLRSLIGRFEWHEDSFEIEHKKGRWLNWSKITTAYGSLDCADCSVCGAIEVPLGDYTSYCPNCGAEMEKE